MIVLSASASYSGGPFNPKVPAMPRLPVRTQLRLLAGTEELSTREVAGRRRRRSAVLSLEWWHQCWSGPRRQVASNAVAAASEKAKALREDGQRTVQQRAERQAACDRYVAYVRELAESDADDFDDALDWTATAEAAVAVAAAPSGEPSPQGSEDEVKRRWLEQNLPSFSQPVVAVEAMVVTSRPSPPPETQETKVAVKEKNPKEKVKPVQTVAAKKTNPAVAATGVSSATPTPQAPIVAEPMLAESAPAVAVPPERQSDAAAADAEKEAALEAARRTGEAVADQALEAEASPDPEKVCAARLPTHSHPLSSHASLLMPTIGTHR